MGLLYFEVEADYQKLIELRQQIAGLEKQMTEAGLHGAKALEPLEKEYARLSALQDQMLSKASSNAHNIQSVYTQMGSVSTGLRNRTEDTAKSSAKAGRAMADGMVEAESAAQVFNDTLGGLNAGLGKTLNMMSGLGSTIGTAFGVGAIGMFINKVQEVRSYFQDIESSMRVFLGDAEKADAFTAELKSYAYYNMFEFSELANASKQLIAYGNDVAKISGKGGIIDKLSNVAAGTGVGLEEMVRLYNKAKSTGQVMSRDIESWAAKGIVIRDELKAMGQEAATGAVTFKQLDQVLDKVTGEGGRFHNLMAEQMNNLSASKGQLQDNLDTMYNEIGEKLQPLLKGTIDMAGWLVDNYETVGKTVLMLASTYGIYRVMLGITNALDNARAKQMEALRLVISGEAKDISEATAMMSGENKERMANVAAIREEIAAKKEKIATDILEKKNEARRLTARLGNIQAELDELDAQRPELKKKAGMIGNATAKEKLSRNESRYNILLEEQSNIKEKLETVNDTVKASEELLTAAEAGEAAMTDTLTVKTNILTVAKEKLKATLAPLGKVLASPYFWAAAAITAATVAVYNLVTAETAEERAVRVTKDWLEACNEEIETRKSSSNGLINAIKDETKTIYEQVNAYERLLELYPELKKYTRGELKDMEMDKFNEVLSEIETERAAKAYQDRIDSITERIRKLEVKAELEKKVAAAKGPTVVGMVGDASFAGAGEIPLHSMFPKLFGEEYDSTQRQLENARAELKELREERDRQFKEQKKNDALSKLSSEERIDVLKTEAEVARANKEVYDNLYTSLSQVRDKDTETLIRNKQEQMEAIEKERVALEKEYQSAYEAQMVTQKVGKDYQVTFDEDAVRRTEKAGQALADFTDRYQGLLEMHDASPELFFMLGDVDEQLREAQRKMEEARANMNKSNGKDKIRFQSEFEASQTLVDKLKKVRNILQTFMDGNPLKIAFSTEFDTAEIEGWDKFNRGQRREIKKFIKRRDAILNDAGMGDKEKAEKLKSLYLTTEDLLNGLKGTDATKEFYEPLGRFIRELGDERRDGLKIINEGITGAVDMIMGEGSEDMSKDLRDANGNLQKAVADYGNLWQKIAGAEESLDAAESKLRGLEAKYRSGKGEVSAKELEEARSDYDVALKAYNELTKEAQKYEGERESLRKLAIKRQREMQDIESSIRKQEIALMHDGAEKSLAEVRYEFDKRKEEIQRGFDDIREQRMQAAKEEYNAQTYKRGQFSESAFLAGFRYEDEDIALRNAQDEANVVEYIRKVADLTKSSQTEAEKKTEERRKADEQIKLIEQSILEIERNITAATKEEGQQAIKNLKERLQLAESIRDALGFSQSKNDYLMQYGSALMKREAVNEKYDNQIGLEQDEWKRRSLEEQRQKELSQITLDELKKNIDWAGALQDLGGEFADYASKIYEQAYAYAQTDEFRTKAADEQKAFLDMLAQVRDNLPASISDLNFIALGKSLNNYRDKMDKAVEAEKRKAAAEDGYRMILGALNATTLEEVNLRIENLEAERKTLQSRSELTEEEQDRLNDLNTTISATQASYKAATRAFNDMTDAERESEQAQTDADSARGEAADKLQKATTLIQDWAGGLHTLLGADSLTDIYNGLSQFFSGLGGKWGGIIGAVLGIADDLIASFAGDDWMLDKNQRNFRKLAESTSEYIEAQEQVIDMLLDMADEGSATERAQIYGDINDRINKDIDKLREEALAYGDVNRRTWWQTQLKGTDTINQEIADWKNEDFNTLMRAVGMGELDKESQYLNPAKAVWATNDALARLYNMDAEGIRRFMRDYTDIYSKLPEEVQGYLTRLLGMLDKADETVRDLNESMLHITFDDMYSSFVNKMKDMKTTAYDTAGDISEMFFNAMMENRFASAYKSRISQLYEDMSKDLEATSESEMEGRVTYWQGKYNDIVSEALKERDRIAQLTGYDQAYAANQASSRGFQAMSQDVGNELNGRFAALQIEGERIRGYQETQTEGLLPALGTKVDTLIGLIGGDAGNPISHVISDVQTTLNNSYLELQAINANTGSMLEFWAKNGQLRSMLDEIRRNTAKIK